MLTVCTSTSKAGLNKMALNEVVSSQRQKYQFFYQSSQVTTPTAPTADLASHGHPKP